MTLYDDKKEKCAVCRKESTFIVLTSTNSFGSPDLDLRPAGQERHSISFRLQECKYCGYVNTSIGKLKANSEKTMSEPAFIDIQNEDIKIQSFKKFFKASLFAENANELGQAAYYSLCSAWFSDDRNNVAYSDLGRTRALQLFQRQLAEHNLSEEDALNVKIQMIDLSRRIADWQLAKKLANEVLDRTTNETIKTVASFQLSLIERRSTDVHTIEQAGALDEE